MGRDSGVDLFKFPAWLFYFAILFPNLQSTFSIQPSFARISSKCFQPWTDAQMNLMLTNTGCCLVWSDNTVHVVSFLNIWVHVRPWPLDKLEVQLQIATKPGGGCQSLERQGNISPTSERKNSRVTTLFFSVLLHPVNTCTSQSHLGTLSLLRSCSQDYSALRIQETD